MREGRVEPELTELRELAEALAKKRKRPTTTAHLLAAISARTGQVGELLVERRLDMEVLLAHSDGTEDPGAEAIREAMRRAREIAARTGANVTATAHLLVALLGDRRTAAHQSLVRAGADVTRLRSAAMNLALGLIGPRRIVGRAPVPACREARGALDGGGTRGDDRASSARPASARPSASVRDRPMPPARPRGVALPVIPSMKLRRSEARPAKAEDRERALAESQGAPAAVPGQTRPALEGMQPASADAPGDPRASASPPSTAGRLPATLSARGARRRSAQRSTPGGTERFVLDAKRMPTLCGLGQNLTLAAARGELDPVIGRDDEIERALDVLAKRQGNSPVFVGPAGVGKSSVLRGVAQRIAGAAPPSSLDDRILIEIPIGELVAGTGVRGALAGRVAALRKEIAAARGRVVVCFDDIDQLFAGEAADEIAGDVKLALARGELPCIGTASRDAYVKVIESDPALSRRFTPIDVEEPSREDAFLILDALSRKLEAHHLASYPSATVALSVSWSVRYLPGRALPDKALSLLDLSGARARRRGLSEVSPETLAEVVAEAADMPVERLLETDGDRMLKLELLLAERVVGHQAEIGRIARILRRNAAGLGDRRPLGSFLLLGPTGVGKTETAKALADVLFQTDSAMTRIDLSEYSEPHSIARLIGAPPGYVGHDAGGQLTEAARRRPYQVLLLDEIEKAHPEVLLAFLPLLDEGRMTDGRGRLVDFTNTIVMMTSNVGAEASGASRKRRVGFGSEEIARAEVETGVLAAARAALAPELYNRIDEVLVFAPLSRQEVREIARRALARLGRTLRAQRDVRLEIEEPALDALLAAGGYDASLGARPLRRTIARLVEAPLAELILHGAVARGDTVVLKVSGSSITLDVVSRPEHHVQTARGAEPCLPKIR